MATIGQVILKLEAQHADLKRNLQDSRQELKQTAEAGQSMAGVLKGALAGIVIGAGIAALKSWTMETIASATAAYRLSGALGITTGSLKELQFAGLMTAGLGAEEFNGVLRHMLKNLGEAGEGAGPAADALKKMGIAASDLKGLHTDEAFKLIATKIGEIKDPAAQSRAAVELFGKEGQMLLPMFQAGAKGIDEARAMAQKLGLSMSDIDAAKLVMANQSFALLGAAAQGFENKLVVAIAPALTAMTDKIMSLLPTTETVSAGIMTGLKFVAKGVGYAIDAYGFLKAGVIFMAEAGVAALEGLAIVVGKVADGVVWVSNKLLHTHMTRPKWIDETTETFDAMRKSLDSQAMDALAAPSAVSKIDAFFDHMQQKATDTAKAMAQKKADMAAPIAESFGVNAKKIEEILKGLQDDVNNFGLTDAQKKAGELKQLGATPQQMAQAKASADRLKQMEEWKKDQDEAKKILEDGAGPLEKYAAKLKDLDRLRTEGMLNNRQYAEAVGKQNKELEQSFKSLTEEKKTGAVERRFDFSGPTKSPPMESGIKQLARLAEMQQKDVEKSTFYLQQIYNQSIDPDNNPDQTVDWTSWNGN